MADAEVSFALQAMDEYSGVFDELQDQIEDLSGAEIDIDVMADDSATPVLDEIAENMETLDGREALLTVAADDEASGILDDIMGKLDELGERAASVGDLLTAGLVGGIGGAAVGAAGDVLGTLIGAVTAVPRAAAEAESAQTRLQIAVEKSGVSWASVADQTDRYIDVLMKATAFDDEKIKDTAATLLFMGMNYDTAMRTLAAALDLAAARQMDLESSARLLGRAWQGNYSILERYGVVIDEQIKKSGDFIAALDILEKKFGGTAVAMANTMEGEMKRAGNAWENFQEMIGGGINWLGKTLMGGLNWLFGQKPPEKITIPTAPTVGGGTTFITYSYRRGGIVPAWIGGGRGTLVRVAEKEAEAIIPMSQLSKHIHEAIREITQTGVPEAALTEESRTNLRALRAMLQRIQPARRLPTWIRGDFFPTGPTRGELYPARPPWVGGFFPQGPTRGELYPAKPLTQTLQLNINVRGATTADLQYASEVGKQLAKLDVLSGVGRRWF
ncbi:hypothetical protein KEJ39_03910 [Candidatus Bathyarchaeota archaeon]|nr:hypothetical protein [Candidatus Bathyarchaeota archaeon]